jgi:hypothetical protein
VFASVCGAGFGGDGAPGSTHHGGDDHPHPDDDPHPLWSNPERGECFIVRDRVRTAVFEALRGERLVVSRVRPYALPQITDRTT